MDEAYDYPTDEQEEQVALFNGTGAEWLALVKTLWWAPDWGWHEYDGTDDFGKPIRVYQVSTGGWSGNESLLSAMQRNWIRWSLAFEQHRRGGHYQFRINPANDFPLDSKTAGA